MFSSLTTKEAAAVGTGATNRQLLGNSGGEPNVKPVPMKLFAALNTDKSSPNCIPRLCLLTINRLLVFNSQLKTVMIAVRVHGSKRTIRSNEIQTIGKTDIDIDLSFSLQYPHFLKKNVNYLQVMLQRRKRYKSRKILGFETLAIGVINMTEVLQRHQRMEKELDLVGEIKGSNQKSEVVARIIMSSLKCQPIDVDVVSSLRAMKLAGSADRSGGTGDVDTDDFSSNEEGSDSETMADEATGGGRAGGGGPAAQASDDQLDGQASSQQDGATTSTNRSSGAAAAAAAAAAVAAARYQRQHPSSLHTTTRAKLSYLRSQMLGRQASKSRSLTRAQSTSATTGSTERTASTDTSPYAVAGGTTVGGVGPRGRNVGPGGMSNSASTCASVQQKNFKQKLIALIKKFRTDSDDFDTEEQYQEALEQELMQAAASGQADPRAAIEELLEGEDDSDVDDSESEPEWDGMSVSSTPKPSLRPFFSSTTLDKI